MGGRAWVGLAITVFFLSSAYGRIKKERRSGVIQDYGHPVADSLLLLVSALVLASALALVFSLVGTHGGGSDTLHTQSCCDWERG
jgi:hypothetical protein